VSFFDPAKFTEEAVQSLKKELTDKAIIAASGGVDSTVAAALASKAAGDKLLAIYVDTGYMRLGESEFVSSMLEDLGVQHQVVDASERFYNGLKGITDPEEKRKIIGEQFIRVFEEQARKYGGKFLIQGTIAPDWIESGGGMRDTIKSHHNVGGLPEKMHLKLVEPLRELFKDEARKLGREIGLPDTMIQRQPFPGPGLAIRILGNVTKDRLKILREADKIILEEIKTANLYNKLWQSFAVLLPVKTVGVMGDARTYENVVAIRAVTSTDGMTADWAHLPYELLGQFSNRIINEVKGVNRVVYDISSKPPGTIEWE